MNPSIPTDAEAEAASAESSEALDEQPIVEEEGQRPRGVDEIQLEE